MVEESALEENLDVDGLCEMVSACLPEFSTIEKEAVSKWLLDVESKLKQESKENENGQSHSDPLNHISLAALLPTGTQRMRVHHLSETSDAGSDSSGEYFSEVIRISLYDIQRSRTFFIHGCFPRHFRNPLGLKWLCCKRCFQPRALPKPDTV